MKTYSIALAIAVSIFVLPAFAAAPNKIDSPAMSKASPAMSHGEIKSLDPAKKTITLKHGPLLNLDMPAMTMMFSVKSASMLNGLKVGDKVDFVADMTSSGMLVTYISIAK